MCDPEIEAATIAIYAAEYDIEAYPWEREGPMSREGYRNMAKAALLAAERVRANANQAGGMMSSTPFPGCMIGPSEPCEMFQEQTAEIDRLRAALAEAEKKIAVLEDSESCEAITLRTKLAEAERALAQWNDTAGERGLSDPEEMAFQLDGDGRQIKSLKATLAEAERECRQVRETNSEWRQHCQQYEADLAEARKVIIACANQDNGETARSFLERTVDAGEKP